MKRLIWLPLAGFLLIAGAAVAAASPGVAEKAAGLLGQAPGPTPTSSPSPEDTDGSEDTNDDSDSDPTTDGDSHHGPAFGFHVGVGGPDELLDDVLSDLVDNGTITQAQADAITDALDQAVSDKQAELEAQAEQMKETWDQIQSFLDDGVITSDELAQLPADNPISNLEDILADGQITQEELDSVMVGPHFMRGPGGPGHFHVQRMPGAPTPEKAPDSGSDDSSNS